MHLREKHTIGRLTRERIISPAACPAMAGHGMRLAGISEAARDFHFLRVHPPIAHVLVCFSGRGKVVLDGTRRTMCCGQAYLTPPGLYHEYYSDCRRWGVCWIHYDGGDREGLLNDVASPMLLDVDEQSMLLAMSGLYREVSGRREAAVMHHWVQLLQAQVRRMVGPAMKNERLARLWQSVDSELGHDWSAEQLAEIARVSTEHLRRLCWAQYRTSPMRHVTQLRMARAAELLASTPMKVQDVAAAVGYDNAFAFATAYKRMTGATPSGQRQSVSK